MFGFVLWWLQYNGHFFAGLLWVVYFCCGLCLIFGFIVFGVTTFEPIDCLVFRFGRVCDCCSLLLG